MPGCKFKIGLLNLRDCKKPVSAHCRSCNRPICSEHGRAYKDKSAKSALCLECDARQSHENGQNEYLSRVRQRQDIYASSGFYGFYFGHSTTRYERDDYESFETDTDVFEEYDDTGYEATSEYEDDISPADFQDS